VRDIPLMQFPRSIPMIGMTYCGLYRGAGRMIIRKANNPTREMTVRKHPRIPKNCPLNTYFVLPEETCAARIVMRKQYPNTRYIFDAMKIGCKMAPNILNWTSVRNAAVMIALPRPSCILHDAPIIKRSGAIERMREGVETRTKCTLSPSADNDKVSSITNGCEWCICRKYW